MIWPVWDALLNFPFFQIVLLRYPKPNILNIGVTDTEMINNSNGDIPDADSAYNRENKNSGDCFSGYIIGE